MALVKVNSPFSGQKIVETNNGSKDTANSVTEIHFIWSGVNTTTIPRSVRFFPIHIEVNSLRRGRVEGEHNSFI